MLLNRNLLFDRIENRTVECESLDEREMMLRHGPLIWKAKTFTGTPNFYPVYRFENYYSYSLLALIMKKKSLALNQEVIELANNPSFTCVMSDQVIDRSISRIGGPHKCSFNITDADVYAQRIAEAMNKDIESVEEANPGLINAVLCGGKDSLNLLLLPWKNKTVALSADPNYEYVKTFITKNNLAIPLIKLEDEKDPVELEQEILACCCRVDLSQWRWGASLLRFSSEREQKVVFWKGQAGDLYMSTTWKSYMHPVKPIEHFMRRAYRKTSGYLPFSLSHVIGRKLQPRVIKASWDRTASLQGSHMGFLREITDSLSLSAYHGPEVLRVWEQADLAAVAHSDMRPKVGMILLGREVIYPEQNPAPRPSSFRKGLSKPENFFRLLTDIGISVC